MTCPICENRKAARFCPAKGENICAVCCGTEREVTISCRLIALIWSPRIATKMNTSVRCQPTRPSSTSVFRKT